MLSLLLQQGDTGSIVSMRPRGGATAHSLGHSLTLSPAPVYQAPPACGASSPASRGL